MTIGYGLDEVVETTGLRLQQLKGATRDMVGWRDVVRVVTRGRLRPMEQGDKVH